MFYGLECTVRVRLTSRLNWELIAVGRAWSVMRRRKLTGLGQARAHAATTKVLLPKPFVLKES
jgi:hypothetical protein